MSKSNLKKLATILGIVVASISIYAAFVDIPWNLATGLAKNVDTDKLEQELGKIRNEDIKSISGSVENLTDKLDKLEKNVENILQTLNREIIPTINRAHDSIFVRIKEVEYISMALHDTLSALVSTSSIQSVREIAKAVSSKLDSLEMLVHLFYAASEIDSNLVASKEPIITHYLPYSIRQYDAILASIDSLGRNVTALQRRVDLIYENVIKQKKTAEK